MTKMPLKKNARKKTAIWRLDNIGRMKIAVLELTPTGHYTLVESVVNIYATNPTAEITIFTNENGEKHLNYLVSDQNRVKIVTCGSDTGGGAFSDFFHKINAQNFNKLFVVTLETTSNQVFEVAKAFAAHEFNCPIYFFIHNIDNWFGKTFFNRLHNVLFDKITFSSWRFFKYQIKFQFIFPKYNPAILEKVRRSGGKLVALSPAVADGIGEWVARDFIEIIPFSFYNPSLRDTSSPDVLRLCLPGFVSATRRDYFSIFKMLDELEAKNPMIKNKLIIDLLGGISVAENGESVVAEAKKYIAKGFKILLYERAMVSVSDFDASLAASQIVVGNLHLKQGASGMYGKSKESGLVFTMIKAGKIGIVPAEYNFDEALKTSILTFKNYTDLGNLILNLVENPEKIKTLQREAIKNAEQFLPQNIYKRLEKEN
jgi:hypothetical protein